MRPPLFHKLSTMVSLLLALLLLAMLTLAGTGCRDRSKDTSTTASSTGTPAMAKQSKHFTVGVLLPPQDELATQTLQKAIQDAATADNLTLTVQYLTGSFSTPSGQPVQTLLNAKPDAVILFNYGSESMETDVQAANTAHVPAFTVEDRAHAGLVVGHIQSNDEQGGKMAGKRLADLLHEKGGVLILAGDFVPKAIRAFRDELSHHPGMQILAETSFNNKTGKSEADIHDAFAKFGSKINGIFTLSDSDGEHALEQCAAQERKDVALIGFRGSFFAQDAMKQGSDSLWKAEVSCSTADLGKAAVKQAAGYLRGKKVAPVVFVDMETIDASNMEKWAPPIWTISFD